MNSNNPSFERILPGTDNILRKRDEDQERKGLTLIEIMTVMILVDIL